MFKRKEGGFLGNVLSLFTGTVISQAILFFSVPFLARLFSPTDFGYLSNYNSIIVFVSSFVTFRLDQALVLPKRQKDGLILFMMSIASTLIVFFLSVIAVAIILGLNLATEYNKILVFVPLGILFSGMFQSLSGLSLRLKSFKLLAISKAVQSISITGFQISFFYVGLTSFGLILGHLLGFMTSVILMLKTRTIKIVRSSLNIKKSDLESVWVEHKDFSFFQSLSSAINAFSMALPVFFLTAFYSPAIAGMYAMCFRILSVPINLIGQNVRQAFLQRASELFGNQKPIKGIFLKSTLGLAAIALVPFTLIYLFNSEVVSIVLGSQWAEAGPYMKLIVFWSFFLFINPPAVTILTVFKRHRFNFFFDICLLAGRVGSIAVGFYIFNDPIMSILLFTLTSIFFNLLIIGYSTLKVFKYEKNTIFR